MNARQWHKIHSFAFIYFTFDITDFIFENVHNHENHATPTKRMTPLKSFTYSSYLNAYTVHRCKCLCTNKIFSLISISSLCAHRFNLEFLLF